ncbi:MAG: thioredoxin domain-containing protein [Nitrososphaerales archaeon]|nr:thioredoxin domain-containing protein [Nitrososphaerales archaeon]
MESQRKPNRLIKEKSPYLLKHAYNPVDWYTWNDEALARAKNDGKPIFLSIGYSSCHWCNAMERESFEDEETAAYLNKHFIPIKVDREERPELDAYYMNAVQAMTGGGGWPLTVFLTPDLRPFYGGTYFPPNPRQGMPSFMQVLEFVAKLWNDNKGEVSRNAEQVAGALQEEPSAEKELTKSVLDEAYAELAASFDTEHGGFGGAPKFPLPLYLEYLLRYNFRTGKELALKAVTKTLDEIGRGGIRDHVGGGFHRYSTDRLWLVPHFEKMLYDNALLARVYLRAFRVTGAQQYASAATDALGWMIREMASTEGAFYSAQDADTDEGEGVYYAWTPGDVERVVGRGASDVFCYVYGVTRNGNFEGGKSLLNTAHSLEEAASRFGVDTKGLEKSMREWKSKLYEARLKRPRPATDTKVLTSWNGLAISALAEAGRTLQDETYLAAARKAAKFILTTNRREGSLFRRYAGGEAAIPGVLEDYAFFAEGLLDLFEATGEPQWLEESLALSKRMVELFWEEGSGSFFMSVDSIPARVRDDHDGPVPSGSSSAVVVLTRLSAITGEDALREKAEKALRQLAYRLERQPTSHTYLLGAADMLLNGMREVVITGKDKASTRQMAREATKVYIPDSVLVTATKEHFGRLSRLTPLLEGRTPGPKPVAYVCQNFACKLPARTAGELAEQLGRAKGFRNS